MRQISIGACLLLIFLSFTNIALANPDLQGKPPQDVSIPCSLILKRVKNTPVNASGVALVSKIKREIGDERTSISIHAHHLPNPSSLGDYDSYEGFAQIPGVISWRFRLYPTPDSPTWAGRFDEISIALTRARVQVRLSNSKTNTLGPVVLENMMKNCSHY